MSLHSAASDKQWRACAYVVSVVRLNCACHVGSFWTEQLVGYAPSQIVRARAVAVLIKITSWAKGPNPGTDEGCHGTRGLSVNAPFRRDCPHCPHCHPSPSLRGIYNCSTIRAAASVQRPS